MKTSASRLLWLFGTHFYISAFTFGGGYVIIPMIRKAFVGKKNLFDEKELLDMAAVAQSVPGAIAVNMAVLTGYRTAGRLGRCGKLCGLGFAPPSHPFPYFLRVSGFPGQRRRCGRPARDAGQGSRP